MDDTAKRTIKRAEPLQRVHITLYSQEIDYISRIATEKGLDFVPALRSVINEHRLNNLGHLPEMDSQADSLELDARLGELAERLEIQQ